MLHPPYPWLSSVRQIQFSRLCRCFYARFCEMTCLTAQSPNFSKPSQIVCCPLLKSVSGFFLQHMSKDFLAGAVPIVLLRLRQLGSQRMPVKKIRFLLTTPLLLVPLFVGCLGNKNMVSNLLSNDFREPVQAQTQPVGSETINGSGSRQHQTENRQATFLQPVQSTSVEPIWHESFEDAQRESVATGKPIMADFTGSDWCPPCIALKKNVFETQEFKSWASENVVLLELDFPKHKPQPQTIRVQNQQLAQKLGIQAYPTVIFLSPDGKRLGKMGFASNASQWLAGAKATLSDKTEPRFFRLPGWRPDKTTQSVSNNQ